MHIRKREGGKEGDRKHQVSKAEEHCLPTEIVVVG